MSLSQGKRFGPEARFGPYEIVDLIGVGGMGEVYRARDTRLDRTVALKVLTATAADKHNARARFEREARAISSLSHPHICAVYDVGHEGDVDYIVMEYLQGESLSTRLSRRGLRFDHALQYAVQTASALAEAHRAGIVHRDLKPGNVMLTPSGAKLLDFGLAKRLVEEPPLGGTTSDTVTVEGQLVGTLPYMAPEQVEGKEADARSDIFSFGAMLHEMLTHQRAFDGNQAHLIAAIISSEPPPPSTLQPRCPPELDHLVARCLAKDPSERWQSADDLLLELKWAAARAPAVESPRRHSLRVLGWAAGTAAVSALVAVFLLRTRDDGLPNGASRQVTMSSGWESTPAVSPDGGLIAYTSDESGNPDIWIVDARGGNAIRLTDDPGADTDPAWLPDGSALLFTSNRGGRSALWRVLRFGGAASLVVPDAEDAAVSSDGTQIAFARPGPTGERRIWTARMGEPTQARMLTREREGLWDHRHPAFSPDGRAICYDAQRDLWMVRLDGSGAARRLTTDDEHDVEPAWSADGRFVYFSSLRGGAHALWRIPSAGGAPQRLTLGTGPERHPSLSRDGKRMVYSTFSGYLELVLHDLRTRRESRLAGLGAMSPSWTPDGHNLVFASARIGGRFDLWIQPLQAERAAGPPRRLTDQPGSVAHPTVSPDGRWVAYYRVAAGQRDIWTVPVAGGPAIRFTDDPAADIHPAWSPHGNEIAFASERGGASRIWIAPVKDGHPVDPPRRLTSGTVDKAPAWSPDGKWIAYIGVAPDGATDVRITDASGSGEPRMLSTEGKADRVLWDARSQALYVSGRWDAWVSVRKYLLNSGWIVLDPPLRFGQNADLVEFDISRDGHVVAFGRDALRGDIWTLESLDRPY